MRAMLCVSSALIVLSPAAAADPPDKDQIALWIKQLGDDSFAVREKASKQLWEAGRAAEPALQEAAQSKDVEVSRRARNLLDRFKWGIYADTPPKVVELITRYRSADPGGKQAVVKELFGLGGPGCAALLKLLSAEDDAGSRRALQDQVASEARQAVPLLVGEENFTALEQILELCLAGEAEPLLAHYAAYYLMRGKLDEQIARFQQEAGKPHQTRATLLLIFLHRAKGDLAAAGQAAKKAQRSDLIEAVLLEAGDWKALARHFLDLDGRQPIEVRGLKAAAYRRGGEAGALETLLKEFQPPPGPRPPSPVDDWMAAKMLMLNERPLDALPLLNGPYRTTAFEVLCARMQYRAALALAEKSERDLLLGAAQARTLYLLGEKEAGRKLFAELGERIQRGQESSGYERLVAAELRVGLRELAVQHCARALAATEETTSRSVRVRLLGRLFPGKGGAAEAWWEFLRKRFPGEKPPAILQKLGERLAGQVPAEELKDMVAQATGASPAERNENWLLAAAEVCQAAKDEAMLVHCLETAAQPGRVEPLLRLGDFHAARKHWEQAAKVYRQAWERDRREPLPLYLHGWALGQAGQEKEGKRLMELAHWLPLGNEDVRFAFVEELAKRKQTEAARREAELLLRTGVPGSFYSVEGFRHLALAAHARKDYLQAADYHDRAMLRCLRPSVHFTEDAAYIGLPAFVHRMRARGLLAAGKIDAGLDEARLCDALLPGNSELPILLCPELERLGRKADADKLFADSHKLHAQLCRDYPKSAWCHNGLAWLCAACRRNLDEALEHAQKAVEMEPDNPGFLDTLAEVHFQRGDGGKAVESIKKAIALDGRRTYFRRQLRRFEAGDPKADIPPQAEDD